MFKTKKSSLLASIAMVTVSTLIYLWETKKPKRNYENKVSHDTFNSSVGLVNKLTNSLIVSNSYSLFDLAKQKNFGLLRQFNISEQLRTIYAIILIDIWQYWWHRFNHKLPVLWQFHKFHHQDEQLNASSAIRFHFLEISISTIIRIAVFIPLGIDKKDISIYESFLLPIIIFHHANINISDSLDRSIKRLIVTPSFHRIHHSKNENESNNNYSSLLSFWDNIFNSYIENDASNIIDFGIQN
ncbi:MAG: sterol desaturase family protein [Candidatus Sericytochromatia bacterium]|nr:sterol desaturase family protein [Candidatus Sericytochromatia bacterium]